MQLLTVSAGYHRLTGIIIIKRLLLFVILSDLQ